MTSAVYDASNCSALLTTLANSIPESYVAVFNNEHTLEFVSTSSASLSHQQLKKNLGKTLSEALKGYDSGAYEKICEGYHQALGGERFSFDVLHLGESEHHIATPILNAEGGVEKILCIIQNLTEQKRSLDALRENETHLKVASQLAKIGYWELDIASFTFTFNDQFMDILKVAPSHFGGYEVPAQRYAEEFLFEEDRPLMESETQLAIDTDDPHFSRYIEHRFIDGKGDVGYLGVRFIAIKDDDGVTVKTVGANQDITERKLAEEELQTLLQKTTDQNRRLKDFSFMTSHNIRSSVANLVGLSQLLMDEPGNLDYITMLQTTVNKLDNTVKNINTLLNYESVLESEARQNCNLQQAIERFCQLNASWIKKEQIELESRLPADFSVNYVPAYVDSVIYNLLSNAIKYGITARSRKIEIGRVDVQCPAIYVRDFGEGLDLNTYGKKLFKPGCRFHTSSEGQGMGLYMTKNQLESCGGDILVESSPGEGTTFTVYFGSH